MIVKQHGYKILLCIILTLLCVQASDAKVYNATIVDRGGNSFDVYDIKYLDNNFCDYKCIDVKIGEAVVTLEFEKIRKIEYDWNKTPDQILTVYLKTGDVIKGNPQNAPYYQGMIFNSLPFKIDSMKVVSIEFEGDITEEERSMDGEPVIYAVLGSGFGASMNETIKRNNGHPIHILN